jgi:predicted  nucleic acid-binding Zn-ribbon protein
MNISYFENKIMLTKTALENAKTEEQRNFAAKKLRKLDSEFFKAWRDYSEKLQEEQRKINQKASELEDAICDLRAQYIAK